MAKSKKDLYVNRAFTSVTMSAANTITFQQINFAVGVFQGIALKLCRLEYHVSGASLQEIIATTDVLEFALTLRNDLTSLLPTNQSVVDRHEIRVQAARTAEGALDFSPVVSDFSSLPMGGILMPANPIYIGATTAGFAAAATVYLILYYTFEQLSDRESIELLQSIIPGNV